MLHILQGRQLDFWSLTQGQVMVSSGQEHGKRGWGEGRTVEWEGHPETEGTRNKAKKGPKQ